MSIVTLQKTGPMLCLAIMFGATVRIQLYKPPFHKGFQRTIEGGCGGVSHQRMIVDLC